MHRLIFALFVSLAGSAAFAAPRNDMAARTELHTIDTLTLSDAQFLIGDANARATVTTGVLRIPRGHPRVDPQRIARLVGADVRKSAPGEAVEAVLSRLRDHVRR